MHGYEGGDDEDGDDEHQSDAASKHPVHSIPSSVKRNNGMLHLVSASLVQLFVEQRGAQIGEHG